MEEEDTGENDDGKRTKAEDFGRAPEGVAEPIRVRLGERIDSRCLLWKRNYRTIRSLLAMV